MSDDTVAFLKSSLQLSDVAKVASESIFDVGFQYRPDLVLEDNSKIFIVEIAQVASFEKIAQLRTFRDVLLKRYENYDVIAVLAVKSITTPLEKMAEEFQVRTIKLPGSVGVSRYSKAPKQKTKLTSEKTWKLVAYLLKERLTSINQLSIKAGVSYGLAHLAVNLLVEKGIVVRKAGYYEVVDMSKLLNAIAWERPLGQLKAFEIYTTFTNSHAAAREITAEFSSEGIDTAFTSYTTGSLYTGYAVRHDAVYLYLEKEYHDKFIQMYESVEDRGVKAVVYTPDRDVFSDSRDIEGVSVVSPGQALLDLAGLGYSGMDMTNAMVEKYGNL